MPHRSRAECPQKLIRAANAPVLVAVDWTMQNRYVGDIGDYLKLGILRALSPGYHLGVAWWLFPDEAHNRDGRYIGYLDRPDQWRHFDPDLFDTLRGIVSSGRRSVRELEAANILPGATFASEFVPAGGPPTQRGQARREWLEAVQRKFEGTDLLFLDPDNGLEPAGFHPTTAKSRKSIMISEVHQLARTGRCLIVYHHHTRRAGGHHAEMQHWADRLRASGFATVDALRARPFSRRVYFLLGRSASHSATSRTDRGGLAGLRYVASVAPCSVTDRLILCRRPASACP
jgi:hypothetical protein